MNNFQLKSYAKINLLLKIIGKNHENYHELEMLTALTSAYDIINFNENNKNEDVIKEITLADHVPAFNFDKKNNSIISALNLVRRKFKLTNYFDIKIKKNIPAGSGLGGGSSNAACILIHFAKLFNQNPATAYLDSELKAISSDIFCFINEHPLIFQSGIGDKVSKVNFKDDKDSIDALLFFPKEGFSTVSMYKNFSSSCSYSESRNIIEEIDYLDLLKVIDNDFLKVVKELYPKVYKFFIELSELNLGLASMSGSGSTFFLIPNKALSVMEAISKITEKHCISYINTKILLK